MKLARPVLLSIQILSIVLRPRLVGGRPRAGVTRWRASEVAATSIVGRTSQQSHVSVAVAFHVVGEQNDEREETSDMWQG